MTTLTLKKKVPSDTQTQKSNTTIKTFISESAHKCPFCLKQPAFESCSDPAIIALAHSCDMVTYTKVVFIEDKKIAIEDWNDKLEDAKRELEKYIC